MTAPNQAVLLRWDNLPVDKPMPLLSRRRVVGEKAMISEVRLDKGCHVPTHAHENEQITCIVSGKLRFGIGVEGAADRYEVDVVAGEVIHLPSNLPHSADALEDTRVLDIFSPPSATTGIDRR
jgi:unsaturated pyranuronate lyase